MSEKTKCDCCTAPKLIFPCSGGSDAGELTDKAARKLTRDGKGKMFCLAGIGGRVSGIMATTQSAADILVIDGCPLDCAANTLKQAGFKNYSHLRLSDIGFEKGRSPVTDESIALVSRKCEELLGTGRGCKS